MTGAEQSVALAGGAPSRMHSRKRFVGISLMGAGGGAIVLLMLGVAVAAPFLAPHSPDEQDLLRTLQPPAWTSGDWSYLLGTDALGRDLLSRVIYGSRISMLVGASAVLIAGAIGVPLGLVSGYFGRWVDAVVMRVADVQLGLPFLVLAIAMVAAIGPGLGNVIVVLGLTGWVTYGRIVRAEVLVIREREYVEAARAIGARPMRVIARHVLPNVMSSVVVVASLETAKMIVAEASLSYLGLGVQPPTPTWGGIIANGRDQMAVAWWLAVFPGLALLLTVLGVNLLGDWLRDALDPTLTVT